MIQVKLYLYSSSQESNEYRGTDLSAYVLSGAQNTENLTEELDVSEIVLQGYPERAEFAPETKFIVEVYQDDIRRYVYHRVVQEDVVEQPILSDNEYFTHTITLIEPSAIAQKRIVDNISVTYKLKDVSLEERPAFSTDAEATMAILPTPTSPLSIPQRGFANYEDSNKIRHISYGKYFQWQKTPSSSYRNKVSVIYTNTNGETVNSDLYYLNVGDIKPDDNDGKKYVQFELPVPHIMWGKQDLANEPPVIDGYVDLGVASFSLKIEEYDLVGNRTGGFLQDYISNSSLTHPTEDTSFPYDFAVTSYNGTKEYFTSEYLIENTSVSITETQGPGGGTIYLGRYVFAFSRYTDTINGEDLEHTNIITTKFEVKEEHTYRVKLSVIQAGNSQPQTFLNLISSPGGGSGTSAGAIPYTTAGYRGFCYTQYKLRLGNNIANNIADNANDLPILNYTPNISYEMYALGEDYSVRLSSGIQYTALNLIKRAIINSDIYYKESNTDSVIDFYSSKCPYPFYISNAGGENIVSETDLSMVQINEAFYHQKNLWEILIEAGKYVHAIPQITFGSDDKFAISFYKLGGTDKKEDTNTKISVMNFRKIDDYVSACSSYVENLVQLGGVVFERVAPKSSSEDYIVSNDTAQIVLSKPIIEIIEIKATITKNYSYRYTEIGGTEVSGTFFAGTTRDISPKIIDVDHPNFIYEQAVYNLLPVRYTANPNKGISMYYELGDNVIRGGDYQLKRPTTDPYSDYAFKKILFTAFLGKYIAGLGTITTAEGPWYNIKINDFIFDVTYRTKDTARVEHTRPDLRHYLLSSKHDKVPTHRQFNNQQDILVDSVSFGGSMFGKLIRTGNSNYKTREWCESFSTVKQKGELYDIAGEWYYVAKVTNIFFPDHIESIVEYSKDYNQLSEIIGIPSEPRFYEISEKSQIDREIAINDYLLATTSANKFDTTQGLIYDISHTKNLIFGGGGTFLKWAKSTLKGDPQMTEEGTFGVSDFSKAVISPISAYSCGNTLTYEWDMMDNFSAGDEVGEESSPSGVSTADNSYRVMRAVQYCDKYGKGTLLDFDLYGDINFDYEQIRRMPNAPDTIPSNPTPVISTQSVGKSIVILKDSREVLHYNYNLMQITDSDRFVLSPYFFKENKNAAKIVLLSEEVNKMSNGYINGNSIIATNSSPTITSNGNYITVDMSWINGLSAEIKAQGKSIVIMESDQTSETMQQFIIARNGDISSSNWYFGEPNKNNLFTRRQ